jgi:hypothetical protein
LIFVGQRKHNMRDFILTYLILFRSFFKPSHLGGRYKWDENITPMLIKKDNVDHIINVIEKATACTEWGADVRKKVGDGTGNDRFIPPYVMSFYDLTGGFDYIYLNDKPSRRPWIQKQITEERLRRHNIKLEDYTGSNISYTPYVGNMEIIDGDAIEDNEDLPLDNYNDSITASTTWAVSSIFMHRCIRKVGTGWDRENKYCLWPLCQPRVNHRPVKVEWIDEFVQTIKTKQSTYWENAICSVVPYSIEIAKDQESIDVPMEFMINSGEEETSADESSYKMGERNLPAGLINCVDCDEHDLMVCFGFLTVSYPLHQHERKF